MSGELADISGGTDVTRFSCVDLIYMRVGSFYMHIGACCMRFDMCCVRVDVFSFCDFGCWHIVASFGVLSFYVSAKSVEEPDSGLQIWTSGKAPSAAKHSKGCASGSQ